MAKLADLERFVELHRDICDAGYPASDKLIERAELFLQLGFPLDYRDFLRRWGTLAIGPLEIYGITGEDFRSSRIPNGIWFTDKKREQLGLPKELLVIYDNNGAEYYCIDTSIVGKCRVVVWDVPSGRISSIKADSLYDFILEEATGLLD